MNAPARSATVVFSMAGSGLAMLATTTPPGPSTRLTSRPRTPLNTNFEPVKRSPPPSAKAPPTLLRTSVKTSGEPQIPAACLKDRSRFRGARLSELGPAVVDNACEDCRRGGTFADPEFREVRDHLSASASAHVQGLVHPHHQTIPPLPALPVGLDERRSDAHLRRSRSCLAIIVVSPAHKRSVGNDRTYVRSDRA